MDSKWYLDKVINRLVNKTRLDYDEKRIYTPFNDIPFINIYAQYFILDFYEHCEHIYGLDDDEMRYVYKQYREIIKDKIEDGQ